jgi:hypothetical protein
MNTDAQAIAQRMEDAAGSRAVKMKKHSDEKKAVQKRVDEARYGLEDSLKNYENNL